MNEGTLNKFIYKGTPISIQLSDSRKTIRVNKGDEIILQNFQNKKGASLDQLTSFVKEYLDLNNSGIKLSDFISEKMNTLSFSGELENLDDSFGLTKSYEFGEKPEGTRGYVQELINLLSHVEYYPQAENIQEINDNITYICDGGGDWDGIGFDELYMEDRGLFFKVKGLVQEIATKYPYTSLSSGSSKTIHYMINQGGLFDNEQFSKQEWADNAKFLDSLVENGTITKLLNEKKLSGDYKMVLTTRVEQYSNYKGGTEELTKLGNFGGDDMKELTSKDFLGVIFSDFEKELIKADGQTFLNFKIALNYFNNLKRSNDGVTSIIDDISILFNNFKCDKTLEQVKQMSPGPEKVKEIARGFVKHIIVSELLEAGVLIDYLREKNLSGQYYWDLDEASYGKLYTVLSRTEGITNTTDIELQRKSGSVSQLFDSLVVGTENTNVTINCNITRVNMTKTILDKLFSTQELSSGLSIEELINLLSTSKETDQDSIIQSIYKKIDSKSVYDKLITPLFSKVDFGVQVKLLANLTSLSDIHSCDNFIDTLSEESLVTIFIQLKGKPIFEKVLSLIEDTNKVGTLLTDLYLKTQDKDYLQLLLDSKNKYTTKELYEKIVLSFDNKKISSKMVSNYFDTCGNLELGKNVLSKIKDLVIKQLMYEYLKSKGEVGLEKAYIKDVLEQSNYNKTNSEVDLSSIDTIIRNSNEDITVTLLNILDELKDSKVDSFKFLNLIDEKDYLGELSDSERLQFFVNFINHLNSGDYESEQLTLSEIYKKIFSEGDSNAITSKIINKFQELKTQNDQRVQNFGSLLEEYTNSANSKKSVIKSFFGAITGKTDSRSLSEIYKDLLNELQEYKESLNSSSSIFDSELTNILDLMKTLSLFKELLLKSELKGSEQFINGVNMFEGNLLQVQKRIESYIVTFNSMKSMVTTLYEKIKGLDALVGIQIIQNLNDELKQKIKELES